MLCHCTSYKAVRNLKTSASFCVYVNMDTCRKVCVAFLMIIVASSLQLCVAEQDTTLPYILPARVTRQGQQQGTCPAQVDLELARNSSREDVVSLVRGRVNPITCPCGGLGQWTRIAYLNMSDQTQQCPTAWNLISTPVRTCGRSSTASASCDSAVFPSSGRSYQQVCGRIIAYQIGDPGAFVGAVRDGRNSIEQQYITGLSLTHGAVGARQHIWSFAAYTTQRASDFTRSCDCASPSQDWPYQSFIDSFVGNDYFCDTGNTGDRQNNVLFDSNPLWDGVGCSGGSSCCQFNNPPWFCKTLPQSTTDDLEIRICNTQPTLTNENTAVEIIEIYVQ